MKRCRPRTSRREVEKEFFAIAFRRVEDHKKEIGPSKSPRRRNNPGKTAKAVASPVPDGNWCRLRAALEDEAVATGAETDVEGTWPSAEATPPKRVEANAQTWRIPDTSDGRLSEFRT